MSKYKVLWIDDQWEDMISFKERCEEPENDFEMVCGTNSVDGMKIFEAHLEEWAGVILDAKVFVSSKSEADRIKGMQNSIDKINELRSKREVPYYIFTGQPDLISSSYFAEQYEGRYYEKDRDEQKLITAIKQNADKLLNTQIIHKHQAVFDCWPDRTDDLLKILKALEAESWQDACLLNVIRKMMEDVIEKLCDCGYCTVDFRTTNLGACSAMLGQSEMSSIIPVHIQRAIHLCVAVTNDGSHREKTDSDIRNNMAPYLIRCLIYSMLDILYWCRELPDPKYRTTTLWRVRKAQENFRKDMKVAKSS